MRARNLVEMEWRGYYQKAIFNILCNSIYLFFNSIGKQQGVIIG